MLEQAMSKLDADERMAIYYKYFADMTVREIAAELKISKSSAARLTEKEIIGDIHSFEISIEFFF